MEESPLTYADRIKQLNDIDQNVTKLLRSAGLAVKALTGATSNDTDLDSPDAVSIEQQKREFTAATTEYFALVSSVDVELRQQIHALEEVEIIAKETASKESQASNTTASSTQASVNAGVPVVASRGAITGGGLGNLDVGWLNSRNDNVGKEMEAELWKQASSFLVNLEESRKSDRGSSEQEAMKDS